MTQATAIKAKFLAEELRTLGFSISPEVCEELIVAIDRRFAEHCNSYSLSKEEAEAISRRNV